MKLPEPPNELSRGSIVWVYLRFSHDGQTIESQERVLTDWCAQYGLLIGRTFRDEALSGKRDAGRKDFLEMIRVLDAGALQTSRDPRGLPRAVLFWSFARMARKEIDSAYYTALLRKRGYIVFTLADDIPQGELAPVFEAFQRVKDEAQLHRLSDEVKRGLEYRIAKGVPHTGNIPRIGYRKGERVYLGPKLRRVNGAMKQVGERWGFKLEKDPGTCARVERAWAMALAGHPDYEIFKETRVVCASTAIGNFFKSLTYAGAVCLGEYIRWDAHEGYVTREQWERVNALRSARHIRFASSEEHPKRLHNPENLLSGIAHCGECHYALSYTAYAHDGVRTKGLRCGARYQTGSGCTLRQIAANVVHDAVRDWLAANVFCRDTLFAMREGLNTALSEDQAALAGQVQVYKETLDRLNREIDNLVSYIRKFGAMAEIDEHLNKARFERDVAQAELAKLSPVGKQGKVKLSDEVLCYLADNFAEELKHAPAAHLRTLLRAVLVNVALFADERLQITYSLDGLRDMLSSFAVNTSPSHWTGLAVPRLSLPTSPTKPLYTKVATLQLQRPPVGYWSQRRSHLNLAQGGARLK